MLGPTLIVIAFMILIGYLATIWLYRPRNNKQERENEKNITPFRNSTLHD